MILTMDRLAVFFTVEVQETPYCISLDSGMLTFLRFECLLLFYEICARSLSQVSSTQKFVVFLLLYQATEMQGYHIMSLKALLALNPVSASDGCRTTIQSASQ